MNKISYLRYAVLSCVLGCMTFFLQAQQKSTFETALNAFLADPTLKNANIGLYFYNVDKKKVELAYRQDYVIPPASTQKVLSTATALELLGSDFRFSTYLEHDSEIVDGVLKGNLYIKGTGDPTLGSQKVGNQNFLYRWAQQIKKAGINRIEGDVIADVSFFDAEAVNPQWMFEDVGNYYAPGIYALPYLDNTLNVQLKSGPIGTVAEVIKTIPYVEGLQFENHIRCTEITYDGAFVHGMPYSNSRYLLGSVPSNKGVFGVKGDLPNPPLMLAKHFVDRLREAGVAVEGTATYMTEQNLSAPQRILIYEHKSPQLKDIVKETNMQSNNMYAEQVFRFLGSKVGVPCTINNSVSVVRNCWRNRGINLSGTFIFDGCGLSPNDAISAKTLVDILLYMRSSGNSEAFVQSLPVSGESGTLKGFLKDGPLTGKVRAKSGTTSRVKSYAGYLTMPNGEQVAFCVIVNNANCRVRNVQTQIEKLLLNIAK